MKESKHFQDKIHAEIIHQVDEFFGKSPSTMKEQYAELIQDRLDGDKKLWNTIQYIIKEALSYEIEFSRSIAE